MIEQTPISAANPNHSDGVAAPISVEATVQSSAVLNGSESTNGNTTTNLTIEAAVVSSDGDREKTLESVDELMINGSKAMKENDYEEAAECFSRALEIKSQHYGELALECVNEYYQFGRALLYKSQEESDPLGCVPKKEAAKDGLVKNGESSVPSALSNADDASGGKDKEDSGDSDADEEEDDESDLDLAWKMLDLARVISEKHSGDIMVKVDILSSLAEASLEREDIETALNDYHKALIILEQMVEPDSRQIAALNFQICLCLELGSKAQEAIPYCQKAISICKSHMQRLTNEVKASSELATSSAITEVNESVQQSSTGTQADKMVNEKEAEVEALAGMLGELEKKLEDLHHSASNPIAFLSEILGNLSARAGGDEKSASAAVMGSTQIDIADSNGGFDLPTVSTCHTNGSTGAGVTHLGVVGRGVKRALANSSTTESTQAKKPAIDSTTGNGEGSAS